MKKGNVILDIGNGSCVFNGSEWVVTTNDAPVSDPRLIVTYNVTDDSQPTSLYGYNAEEGHENEWVRGVDMFTNVEIDGVDVSVEALDTAEGMYQLSNGEHTVKYTLKDPTYIGIEWGDDGIVKIGASFYSCSTIVSVEIPNTVTTIGQTALSGCTGLTSITIPDSVTTLAGSAFNGNSGLTSVTLGNGITSIAGSAFMGCSGLTNVTFGGSVTTIEENAFYNCSSLTNIDIPDSVTSIGGSAFKGCTDLTDITIGSGITSIGRAAFNDSSNITMTLYATNPPSYAQGVFKNEFVVTKIYVPVESVDAYKAASGWSTFASKIEAIPTI